MCATKQERSSITHKVKSVVDAIIQIELDFEQAENSSKDALTVKKNLIKNRVRTFKRAIGVEGKEIGKYQPRTVMKYISMARKLMRESSLMATDIDKQAQKLCRAYKEFSGIINEIAQSEDAKKAHRDIMGNPDTPKDVKDVLKKLQAGALRLLPSDKIKDGNPNGKN